MAAAGSIPAELGELLCLVIDVNPLSWSISATPTPVPGSSEAGDSLSISQALSAVLLFCNAHLALRHENQIAIYAANHFAPTLLYSSLVPASAAQAGADGAEAEGEGEEGREYQAFRVVDRAVTDKVKQLMVRPPDEREQPQTGIVGALAMALSHINRHRLSASISSTPSPSRILLLSVSADHSPHYVPTMNSIFSAQKAAIPIDVCKIAGQDAVFLQQAAHLTGGGYYRLGRRQGLLQYLMMAFLPGVAARRHLTQPRQEQVDLRAACFCHRRIVDTGFVCSVCLSIFCSPVPVCSTCRTKFPMATLKRLGFGAPGTPKARKRKVGTPQAVDTPRAGTPLAQEVMTIDG